LLDVETCHKNPMFTHPAIRALHSYTRNGLFSPPCQCHLVLCKMHASLSPDQAKDCQAAIADSHNGFYSSSLELTCAHTGCSVLHFWSHYFHLM